MIFVLLKEKNYRQFHPATVFEKLYTKCAKKEIPSLLSLLKISNGSGLDAVFSDYQKCLRCSEPLLGSFFSDTPRKTGWQVHTKWFAPSTCGLFNDERIFCAEIPMLSKLESVVTLSNYAALICYLSNWECSKSFQNVRSEHRSKLRVLRWAKSRTLPCMLIWR